MIVADTRSTVHDIVPSRRNIVTHWADDTKACNNDTSLHGSLLICDNGGQAVWSSTTESRKTRVAFAPDFLTA